jgi:hypothetical protein
MGMTCHVPPPGHALGLGLGIALDLAHVPALPLPMPLFMVVVLPKVVMPCLLMVAVLAWVATLTK